jgi:hypothetical protein
LLRKILEPKNEEVAAGWRKLRNENFIIFGFYEVIFYYMIRSGSMGCEMHVARIRGMIGIYLFIRKLKEKRSLQRYLRG